MLGAWVEPHIAEKIRDVAYWDRKTISQVMIEALEAYVESMEHNRGSPYKKRPRSSTTRRGRKPLDPTE